MDTYLDTLSDELCQANTYVGCITQRQAHLGGFMASPSPSPEAFVDKDDDGDSNSDDAEEDSDASSFGDDEMTTWITFPLSFVTKRGSSFGMKVVMYWGGELVYDIFVIGGVFIFWGM